MISWRRYQLPRYFGGTGKLSVFAGLTAVQNSELLLHWVAGQSMIRFMSD